MAIETITVATDLSERSEKAVQRAAALARQHDAALTVLSVIDEDLPDDLEELLVEKTRAAITTLLETLEAPRNVTIDVRAGDPVEEMIAATHAMVDLFVVGTHRRRAFLDVMWETTAQKTVRHAPCPVLLVREDSSRPYAAAVVATDFSQASTKAARQAATLAPGIALHPVNALHVPYEGRLARAPGAAAPLEAAFLNDATASAEAWQASLTLEEASCGPVTIEKGGAGAVIARAVEEQGVPLLAIGAHGRAGALPAILGSVANDLLREPPCDVLIVR
ncbi:MAG: universal stress protein [Pseudomonadota bacterium]